MGGDLITQGLELLVAGMGAVFVFLGLLVGACAALARAVRGGRSDPVLAVATSADDDELVAAVTAAIRHHRRLHPAGGG